MSRVFLGVEDDLSAAVAAAIVREAVDEECELIRLHAKRARGFGQIKVNMPKYVDLAKKSPVFLLTDLDEQECPRALIVDWSGTTDLPPRLSFRVAVREVEAWVMADREGFAHFLGVSAALFPMQLDTLTDPKSTLLDIARRGKRSMRSEIIPAKGVKSRVGLGYNEVLSEFVIRSWSPGSASNHSLSLRRSLDALAKMKPQWCQ